MNDEVKKAWNLFLEHVQKNSEVQKLMKAVGNRTATYAEALEYSSLLSKLLVESASEIYPKDSQKVLEMLKNSQYCKNYFNHVDKYLYDLQSSLNKDSGLGMKPVKMIKYNQLLDQSVSSSDDYKADIEKYKSKAELSANKHVDTYQQYNAKTQNKAGYKVTVSRTYDGRGLSDGRTCKFCMERVGSKIPYPQAVKKGMFQRHEGCHCVIEYNNNGEKSYQTKKGGLKSWKLNEELSQPYKKIVRAEKRDIEIKTVNINRVIKSRKVKTYEEVYISDRAIIKPKALHKIRKYNNELTKKYGISQKPDILIVTNEELNYNVSGVYLAISNVVVYPSNVAEYTQRHEMWHCFQADNYRLNGGIITDEENYKAYLKNIRSKAKIKIDKLGINDSNVSEISKYANDMFELGKFDEVEAEYEALKGDS